MNLSSSPPWGRRIDTLQGGAESHTGYNKVEDAGGRILEASPRRICPDHSRIDARVLGLSNLSDRGVIF